MRLDERLRALLPGELYVEPPPTRLERDASKLLEPRRREGCASLETCEDGWIARWADAAAACPSACAGYAAADMKTIPGRAGGERRALGRERTT